jgi:hypothetical protein
MGWKLTLGKLLVAWRRYPAQRRALAAVSPGPPILVTGAHRSGTTWFAKMLAASGIWYVHEPFNPNKGRWPQSFSYRRAGEPCAEADALMQAVLDGGFREALLLPNAEHRLMPLRLLRHRVRRVMVKDPLACLLAGHLTRRFGLTTLILFRHPAAFVASVCRLGWPRGCFLRQFLRDQALMEDHLEPYRALLEDHADVDSVASAAVLHGALNTVLWHDVQQGFGTALRFEDVCVQPIEAFERMHRELGLPYDAGVRAAHESLCFREARPAGAYHPHAVARNSRAAAESWHSQLSAAEVDQVQGIWHRFEVPLYRAAEDWEPSPTAREDRVATW